MTETSYQKKVSELFHWLLNSDDVVHDRTSSLIPQKKITGSIISKQDAVIAGLEEVAFFFRQETGLVFEQKVNDGEQVKEGQSIAEISGSSREILSLERTILNILQRMSGIATETQKLVNFIHSQNTFIAATRKTPWGLLDKKAVAVGGGLTHRLNLSDGILIKDNHLEIIKSEFGIHNEQEAVQKVLEIILPQINNTLVEIETNMYEGVVTAIHTFNHLKTTNYLAVMLDNWEPERAVEFIKEINGNKDFSKILFEASGNITEKNISDWAKTGVNIISLGSLTHSVKAADLSMELLS